MKDMVLPLPKKSKRTVLVLPTPQEIEDAYHLVRLSGEPDNFLALSGDKYFLWSESRKSFLMFGVIKRFWIAFGDPISIDETEVPDLIAQFKELAWQHRCHISFYRVGSGYVSLYKKLGLFEQKLGEEAKVNLSQFSMDGTKWLPVRNRYNRFTKAGYHLEILNKSQINDVFQELETISSEWLSNKRNKEKGFSVGRCQLDYLKYTDLGLIRFEGRVVAYANLLPSSSNKTLGIDIMRYDPSIKGMMEFLLVSLMKWAKSNGYEYFLLGMAPLSGLQEQDSLTMWDRVGHWFFENGNRFYNFSGLRQYKEKFFPQWESKYVMMTRGITTIPLILSLIKLISGR